MNKNFIASCKQKNLKKSYSIEHSISNINTFSVYNTRSTKTQNEKINSSLIKSNISFFNTHQNALNNRVRKYEKAVLTSSSNNNIPGLHLTNTSFRKKNRSLKNLAFKDPSITSPSLVHLFSNYKFCEENTRQSKEKMINKTGAIRVMVYQSSTGINLMPNLAESYI